jgi:hypothetical protein
MSRNSAITRFSTYTIDAFLDPLLLQEFFHLEFLLRLGTTLNPKFYAVKGGVNTPLSFGRGARSQKTPLLAEPVFPRGAKAWKSYFRSGRSRGWVY